MDFPYTTLQKCIFLPLVLLLSCSQSDDGPDGQDESVSGTYCLDFSLVGSQLSLEETAPGSYSFSLTDFDGGLRSGTGTASKDGNTISLEGEMQIEQGTANFEATLEYNKANASMSGEFTVLGPSGNPLISSSINAIKGACNFELSPEDVGQILGQPYLTDLHVDLSKIKKISKYRSAAGHNFVDYSGESCVNLKHYFHTYAEGEVGNGAQLPTSLDYYSPANGTVVTIGKPRPSDDPDDYEIDIRLDANPNVIIRIFHVKLLNTIEVGDHLSSGQTIGSAPAASLDAGDFAVYVLTDQGYRHISMFEIMSQNVLDAFIARGMNSNWKEDLYYEEGSAYSNAITCENGTWGNLRHPSSNFELDYFILND